MSIPKYIHNPSSLKCYDLKIVLGHTRDLPSGSLPVCQVRHCLQSLHLLLHVQGLQKGHRDCVQKVLFQLETNVECEKLDLVFRLFRKYDADLANNSSNIVKNNFFKNEGSYGKYSVNLSIIIENRLRCNGIKFK